MTFEYTGEVAALGTALCWTVTALSFEAAGRRVGSLAVNLLRLAAAALFLAIYGWAVRGLPLPTDVSLHNAGWLALSAVAGFLIGDLCLFRALVVIGPRLSTLIMSLAPCVAALLGWVAMDETLSGTNLIGMAVTLSGVTWVVLERPDTKGGKRSGVPAWGIFLALVGAAGQGGGLVLSKMGMAGNYDPFAATHIRVLTGVAGFSILFFALRLWPRVFKAAVHRPAMGFITLGAFFGPFLGVSLSLLSVQYINVGVAQTFMSVIPVLIIPFVIVIHKEKVSLRAVAGAVLAVAGVAILFL
jgi:drug/metabolite transporter (DMT)-like permease